MVEDEGAVPKDFHYTNRCGPCWQVSPGLCRTDDAAIHQWCLRAVAAARRFIGHGGLGRFIRFHVEFSMPNVGAIGPILGQDVYYYAAFRRLRDPAITMHVPCVLSTEEAEEAGVQIQRQILTMKASAWLLCVHTDFTLSKLLLQHVQGRSLITAALVNHKNIPSWIGKVRIGGLEGSEDIWRSVPEQKEKESQRKRKPKLLHLSLATICVHVSKLPSHRFSRNQTRRTPPPKPEPKPPSDSVLLNLDDASDGPSSTDGEERDLLVNFENNKSKAKPKPASSKKSIPTSPPAVPKKSPSSPIGSPIVESQYSPDPFASSPPPGPQPPTPPATPPLTPIASPKTDSIYSPASPMVLSPGPGPWTPTVMSPGPGTPTPQLLSASESEAEADELPMPPPGPEPEPLIPPAPPAPLATALPRDVVIDKDAEHYPLWLTRTGQTATCQSCLKHKRELRIENYEARVLWQNDPNKVADKRVWRKVWWQYYHNDRRCLVDLPVDPAEVDDVLGLLVDDFKKLPKRLKESDADYKAAIENARARVAIELRAAKSPG